MKIRILKKDFDSAIRHPWDPQTCLIAQAGKRQGILRLSDGGSDNQRICDASEEALLARSTFDGNFKGPRRKLSIVMENLRASLPITITLSDPKFVKSYSPAADSQ